MGTVRDDGSQQSMWVATADLPQSAGHPFYERLNRILEAAGAAVEVRSYIAEPDRGRRCWKNAPEARDAVYGNRRRVRGKAGPAFAAASWRAGGASVCAPV